MTGRKDGLLAAVAQKDMGTTRVPVSGLPWLGNPILPEQHSGVPCDEAAHRLGSWSGPMAQAGHAAPARFALILSGPMSLLVSGISTCRAVGLGGSFAACGSAPG